MSVLSVRPALRRLIDAGLAVELPPWPARRSRRLDVVLSPLSNTVNYVESKQVRVIAVASPHRIGGNLAGIPTWKEQGSNVVAAFWRGVIGPKGLSAAQIAFWDGELAKLAQSDEWKKYLAEHQLESDYRPSRETKQFLDTEYVEYKTILGELGLAK